MKKSLYARNRRYYLHRKLKKLNIDFSISTLIINYPVNLDLCYTVLELQYKFNYTIQFTLI